MLSALGAAALALGGGPVAAQEVCTPYTFDPYLFILFDTSGSLNRAAPCSQAEIDAGDCSFLCDAPECRVPLQADSPDSKFFQIKSALHEALSSVESEYISFGFASFNQDQVYASSKHWVYEAGADGVTIPGWGPFPAAGSREVVGRAFTCPTGTGNDGVGCSSTNPADLTDAWELSRVRELPKWGEGFGASVRFFIRYPGGTYRMTYFPSGTATLGTPLSLRVRVERCLNSACSSVTLLGEPTIAYTPVTEYLGWHYAASRIEPIGYFSSVNDDFNATNTCSGWDPNTDTTADRFNGYTLRWPTTTDPRGTWFSRGDVIPFDWQTDHRLDIQQRLAPNLVFDPMAAPDFRISPYLANVRFGSEAYLRLKNEQVRPLIASGSTPLGASLRSFRSWYAGCATGTCWGNGWHGQAVAGDPLFGCRPRNVLLIVDGEENCGSFDPCAVAEDLYSTYDVRTYVVAYGADPMSSPTIACTADEGGTAAFYPQNRTELVQALKDVFVAAGEPPPTWPISH